MSLTSSTTGAVAASVSPPAGVAGPGSALLRRSAVFRAIPDAVLVADLTGRVIDCNAQAERLFGRVRSALIGRVAGQDDDTGRARRQFTAILRSVTADGEWQGEIPVRPPDGQPRLSWTTVRGLHDEDGTLIGLVGFVRDVTDERRASVALQASEERWRLTLDGAPAGIALVDPLGRFVRVNQALCTMVGYGEAELLALSFQDITHPDDLAQDQHLVAQLLVGDIDRYTMDKRYLHADGSLVWVRLTVGLVIDPHTQEPLHFLSQMEDVTERRSAVERRSALLAAQLAIAEIDLAPQKVMRAICEHAQALTGGDGAVIELREGEEMVYAATLGSLTEVLGRRIPVVGSLAGLCVQQEIATLSDDTEVDPRVDLVACRQVGARSMVLVPLRRGRHVIGVLQVVSRSPHCFTQDDVDTLELLAAPFGTALSNAWQLESTSQRAMTDPLTGLANRAAALHELDLALQRQARLGGRTALLFCDVDRFKAVNDTLGHAVGDQVLVALAQQMREAVRMTDTAARYGGDEFVIVCEAMGDADDAGVLAERLLRTVPGIQRLGAAAADIGLSIGIAITDGAGSVESMLEAADQAMYAAKRGGGNRHVVRLLH